MDKALAEDFDNHLRDVMEELQDVLKSSECPIHVKNAHILKAKLNLNDICFTKAKEHLQETNEDVGRIFDNLHLNHKAIFNDFFNLIGKLLAPEQAKL